MHSTIAPGWLAATLIAFGATQASSATPERVEFNRDVRPILSDTCFKCHGPDEAARQAGLSLHVREGALTGGDSGPAFVPRKPDESEAVRRIFATGDEQMPPADSGLKLTDAQKDVLRRWIEQGA